MRALIIDPALHSMGGHHYNAVQRLQAELAALGVAAPCLASAQADREVERTLSATPVFERSVYGRSYAEGDFEAAVEATARDLSGALRRSAGLPDLLLLPCCDQVLASAMARQIGRVRLGTRPLVVAWMLYAPHHLKAADDPAAAAPHAESRSALATLKAAVGPSRIRVFCETPSLAAFYRRLSDLDVEVMPGPGLTVPLKVAPAQPVGERPAIVSCIGFANRPKGYRLLPGAVAAVLKNRRDVRFRIHGIVGGSDAEADRPVFDRLTAMGDDVVVRHDVLTPSAYLDWLARCDLLLLPYDPHVYRERGSGVFSDAHRCGIPVVVSGGCSFAEPAFHGGWGVAIESYTPEGLGLAIMTALDQLPDLTACAAAAARHMQDDLHRLLKAAVDDARPRRQGFAGLVRRFAARLA